MVIENKKNKAKELTYQNFYEYIFDKIAYWALEIESSKSSLSEFKWRPEEKRVLHKDISNVNSEDLANLLKDTKYKKFILSIIKNGFNKADLEFFYRFKNDLPLRKLGLVYDLKISKNSEDYTHENIRIPAGFYMLEIEPNVFNPQQKHLLKLSVKKSLSKKDLTALNIDIAIRSGRLTKRLLWIEEESFFNGYFAYDGDRYADIPGCRVVKLPRIFFIDRIMKKLAIERDLNSIKNISSSELRNYYDIYEDIIYGNNTTDANYHSYVFKAEPPRIPSAMVQLRNLKKWRVK